MDTVRAAPRQTPAHSSQGQQRMQLQSARVKFRAKITRCGTKAMVKEKEATERLEGNGQSKQRAPENLNALWISGGEGRNLQASARSGERLQSTTRACRSEKRAEHLRDRTFPQRPRDREHRERRWQPPRCRPQHAWERVQCHRRFRRCLRCNCVKGEGKLDSQPARAEADWGGGL